MPSRYRQLIILICFRFCCLGQDSIKKIPEVDILYQRQLPEIDVPSSPILPRVLRVISPISSMLLSEPAIQQQHGLSMVPAVNTVPGVRMEERSPGSYRISIRGSLIRSPFGIRNIKMYLDEMPFTNASGETYFNLIDPGSISSMVFYRGPYGGYFGSNSGGVVMFNTVNFDRTDNLVQITAAGGSYGMLQESLLLRRKTGNHVFNIRQGYQRSDGFRENSAMNRKFFQVSDKYSYSENGNVKAQFMYADLFYQTPGGLTLDQSLLNPRSARPPSAFAPGAVQQNASIRNRTFFGGITNELKILRRVKNLFSISGSQTYFENPFITNYETRDEDNVSVRSFFEFKNYSDSRISVTAQLGAEYQEMQSVISNYGNNKGRKDSVQAIDEVNTTQGFLFARTVLAYREKIWLDVGASYNNNTLRFKRNVPVEGEGSRRFDPQLLPRITIAWLIKSNLTLRGAIGKGYSSPTLQEVRSSDLRMNQNLDPEKGWNYELGVKTNSKDYRLYGDASVFYYKLSNAIVRRTDLAGVEFFQNSGVVEQRGVEIAVSLQPFKKQPTKGIVRGIFLKNASTLYHFTFGSTGKNLTGVPVQTEVTSVRVQFPKSVYLFIQHNYTSPIPLNDGNTTWARAYDLVMIKAGWTLIRNNKIFEISAGVDNVLDEQYSLGNDLNAGGGRYYNPAPGRNYFIRLSFTR